MLAKIIACLPAAPGTAQLMVRLRGEQALLSELSFILCNNEQNYLHPDGSWRSAQHWFTVSEGYALQQGSGFRIGPTLLDPLLRNASQVQIEVKLASGETRNTTLQLSRDELLSSEANGQTDAFSSSSVLATPEPISPPVAEPVAPPVSMPAASAPSASLPPVAKPEAAASRLPVVAIIVAALVALLLIGGALWWFLGRDSAVTPAADGVEQAAPAASTPVAPEASTVPAAEKTANSASASACTAANLASQNELDFVQNCVQQKLDSSALLAIIQAAKEAKKCGIAQRLYANRAQGGDSKIAIAYAREYDPEFHQAGECFKTADKDTAAYWYETALQSEPGNQQAKTRLEELEK